MLDLLISASSSGIEGCSLTSSSFLPLSLSPDFPYFSLSTDRFDLSLSSLLSLLGEGEGERASGKDVDVDGGGVRRCFGLGGATFGGDRLSLGTRGTGGESLDPLGDRPTALIGDRERGLRGDLDLGQCDSCGGPPLLSPECRDRTSGGPCRLRRGLNGPPRRMSGGGPRGLLPLGGGGDLSCLQPPLTGDLEGGDGERPLFPDPRALFSGRLMSGGGPRRTGTPGPRLYMGGS